MTDHQRPDGAPKNTGRVLHDSIVTIRVDDDEARSNYTIHVEHPNHDGGVRCFHRSDRDMVVGGVRKHLDRLLDGEVGRVEVIDKADLGLSESEVRPDSYDRDGPFATNAPELEVSA